MRISNTTPKFYRSLAAAACLLLALTSFVSRAEDASSHTKPYEWSAELVSFDAATNTAEFRALVASHVEIDGLDTFSDGDRLILTWSGRSWASGIRGLARNPELTPETLSLPVEFVSSERDGRYIVFRIPVPENSVETISGMEAGMRVTGISPRMASNWDNGVNLLRHYNDVS